MFRRPRPVSAPRPARPRRGGLTLLEVIAASAVLAIALAPAMRIVRTSLLAADRLDRQERCLTVANDRVELLMARTAADWDGTVTGTVTGASAAATGYPNLYFYQFATDSATYGGVPGRLAAVGVLAWYDDDGDFSPDANEPQALLASAVAHLTAYEQHAGP